MKSSVNAAILVLGDLNRSPRMLNHAKACSETIKGINEVSLIGFHGGDIRSDIFEDRKIRVYYIPEKINNYLKKLPRFLFLLSALLRIFIHTLCLFYILMFKIPKPDFLILQNPPGIPAMVICAIVCFFRRTTFIIDWHNYGYTILSVNRRNKFIVFMAKIYEKMFGKLAKINFCVSEAMRKHLKDIMNINAINLPDRAIKDIFKRIKIEESHEVFKKYEVTKNKITEIDSDINKVKYKENRPFLMISSTSWTPDEDFDILLNCFINIEKKVNEEGKKLTPVLFLITGRGPMKDQFMKKVDEANLKLFEVKSVWLDSDDYPLILGSMDLGICLHYSSSGYDLPMKVVDMFSSNLPVCAVYYPTIKELVKDKQNGFLFKDANELSKQMLTLMEEFTQKGSSPTLENFRKNLIESGFSENDWVTQWRNIALDPICLKSKIKLN